MFKFGFFFLLTGLFMSFSPLLEAADAQKESDSSDYAALFLEDARYNHETGHFADVSVGANKNSVAIQAAHHF